MEDDDKLTELAARVQHNTEEFRLLSNCAELVYRENGSRLISDHYTFRKLLGVCYALGLSREFEDAVRSKYAGFPITVYFSKIPGIATTSVIWACCSTMHFFTFQICEYSDLVRIVIERWLGCIDLYRRVAELNGFEGDIILSLDDGAAQKGLTFCDNSGSEMIALIPDSYFLGSLGYKSLREVQDEPWENRSSTLYWRGSGTGHYNSEGVLPRVALCRLARDNPTENIDAGLTEVFHDREELKAEGLLRETVPWNIFYKYKYHVDIDGSSNSWPGLFTKLISGGLVFKVSSPSNFRQWYYDDLVSWENFIPVKSDMSDLIENLAYCRANDDKARLIASRGRDLALSMTYERELNVGANTILAFSIAQRSRK